ncbi:Holliday junction resolvase RuvX [Humibacter ginsenosidimutans]|uniref:Putative pre-16S rRNA nuclease n=1 Tax=Humibacter ginsenosidimutans TaxID=2599293 RepID=A0A5B8M8B0_9MICO|nr:Holliday junction resolvase RuvX [Humibacter ginsenosidimutans]
MRIGVDVGRARIGVSRSDPDGMLALPVETVARVDDGGDVARIQALVTEFGAAEIIVGLPLSLSGAHTASTDDAIEFASRLSNACALPVRLVDERLSTVSAQSALHASGRTTRNSRSVVDQAAATVILQHALDTERSSGRPPGELVSTSPAN